MSMSFRILLITVIAAVLAAPAAVLSGAPGPPGDDLLGLYTATDATGRSSIFGSLFQFDLYLCLTGCTEPGGVSGWEARVEFPASGVIAGSSILFGGGVNAGKPPDYAVGLATPLPYAPCIVLAQWQPFVLTMMPAFIHLAPITNPSLPERMAYAVGDDPGRLVEMAPCSGDFDQAVFGFNATAAPGCDAVPAHRVTWSAVKALYR
jgi:hypothetical protein